ncbi:hypothetical protein C8R45DRAFT_1183931 [Mycena sanguinolenta]|nr:hypothetical protein C8R45DRAFT_1183931 [Mycena sanguinolenta]
MPWFAICFALAFGSDSFARVRCFTSPASPLVPCGLGAAPVASSPGASRSLRNLRECRAEVDGADFGVGVGDCVPALALLMSMPSGDVPVGRGRCRCRAYAEMWMWVGADLRWGALVLGLVLVVSPRSTPSRWENCPITGELAGEITYISPANLPGYLGQLLRSGRTARSQDPGLYPERFDPGSDKFWAILGSNLGAVRTKMRAWRATSPGAKNLSGKRFLLSRDIAESQRRQKEPKERFLCRGSKKLPI